MVVLTAVLVAVMVAVHLFAGRLRFLDVIPRSRWLSGAGGAAVSYVFIHLLPELSRSQNVVSSARGVIPLFREQHIYLTALLGLVVFYGLERAAKSSREASRAAGDVNTAGSEAFALHLILFGIYNALVGYLLLHREVPGLRSLVFFWVAMALHFLSNDYELRMDFQERYRRTGRWALAGAVVLGWGAGTMWTLSRVLVAFLAAFVAGATVLNVLRGELPAERQSDSWAFMVGALAYTLLLLFT